MPSAWRWKGHHVKLVDGTTVTMADTAENQEEYPQQSVQAEGLGFPIARVVVLLSLATGMTCGMAMAKFEGKETGELALFRQLLGQLEKGDVVLADRYFCTFFMLAALQAMGNGVVTRLHASRKSDFRKGKRLGRSDYLVQWERPAKPDWMDEETYSLMPDTLELRQIEVRVKEPGFRTQSLTVITTLTDAEKYTREDVAELYHQRWLAELDIRDIKISVGMDHLRCKTPAMVRKEMWVCLLAYNLIRKTMLQAAKRDGLLPRQLSFTTAMQTIAGGWVAIPGYDQPTQHRIIIAEIDSLTEVIVGNRPNRIEPRAVKKRPKPHRLLTMPRAEAQAKLRSGIDPYAKQK
jgi:hypothetical protein